MFMSLVLNAPIVFSTGDMGGCRGQCHAELGVTQRMEAASTAVRWRQPTHGSLDSRNPAQVLTA